LGSRLGHLRPFSQDQDIEQNKNNAKMVSRRRGAFSLLALANS
jgi:hypothetical protein